VLLGLATTGRLDLKQDIHRQFLLVSILINGPHFMASYRLLYQSREQVFYYKWASLYVPCLLALYLLLAVAVYTRTGSDALANLLAHAAAVYLAWHYTGQAWGMTASFAYIGGVPFSKVERTVLRAVLRVFLAWHVVLYVADVRLYPEYLPAVENAIGIARTALGQVSHAAMLVGAVILAFVWFRSGRKLPVRAIVPIPALYLGYVLLARTNPAALFVLQMSHALQYLIFPMRVELNRYDVQAQEDSPLQPEGQSPSAPAKIAHMALYFAVLVAVGWLVFEGPTYFGKRLSDQFGWFSYGAINQSSLLLIASVNIHHYFTDGCVWKISNPRVRKELFRHLQQPERA
jgi:hypothetical protein